MKIVLAAYSFNKIILVQWHIISNILNYNYIPIFCLGKLFKKYIQSFLIYKWYLLLVNDIYNN